MSASERVGILGLQGCIDPHAEHIQKLGHIPVNVRTREELESVDRLIIPGGESTTVLKLLRRTEIFEVLQVYCKSRPVWGICAGAILLADDVTHPAQESLAVMPMRAKRNAYGSQLDSFKADVSIPVCGEELLSVDFIRAPRLEPSSADVEVLAGYSPDNSSEKHPVLLLSGNALASAFHTELGDDSRLHRYFLSL